MSINIIADNISCLQILTSSNNISKNILHDLHTFMHFLKKNGTYKMLGTVPGVGPKKKYSLNT